MSGVIWAPTWLMKTGPAPVQTKNACISQKKPLIYTTSPYLQKDNDSNQWAQEVKGRPKWCWCHLGHRFVFFFLLLFHFLFTNKKSFRFLFCHPPFLTHLDDSCSFSTKTACLHIYFGTMIFLDILLAHTSFTTYLFALVLICLWQSYLRLDILIFLHVLIDQFTK